VSGRSRRHAASAARPPQPPAGQARLTFTTRAAVLALSLCAVLLALAYPLKQYLAQRSQINSLAAQERATELRVQQLAATHAKAGDPAYIEQQARARLHYTFPGQLGYLPLRPPPATTKTPPHTRLAVPTDPGRTWYDRLWRSDVTAGTAK
jgi:cell division protein FtsB